MLKLSFGNREKLIPTQKPTQMFGLKFGMQGLNVDLEYFVWLITVGGSKIEKKTLTTI